MTDPSTEFEAEFTQLADSLTDRGRAPRTDLVDLWPQFVEMDLPLVAHVGSFADLVTLVRVFASRGLISPLVVSPILASALGAGDDPQVVPLTAAFVGDVRDVDAKTRVRVPWAATASRLVVAGRDPVETRARYVEGFRPSGPSGGSALPFAECCLTDGHEITDLVLDASHRAQLEITVAALLLGAVTGAVRLTEEHTRTREQFGAPLARLPGVRRQLGEARVDLAHGRAALDRAVATVGSGADDERVLDAALVAAVVASEVATRTAMVAHQLHGAVGTTQEYALGAYTRAVWAFRDWPTSAAARRRHLGERALHGGANAVWDTLTAPVTRATSAR